MNQPADSTRNTHVVIAGAGFGALTTVRSLRKAGFDGEITVVSPRAEFQYLPGLIWIPSGLRQRGDLLVPLADFFMRNGVRHIAAEVTGASDDARVLHTSEGPVENDALVIATGGRFLKTLPGMEHAIVPCEGVGAAEAIGQRLANMQGGRIAIGFSGNPAEPAAVRGGPMFEFLFGIDRQLRREGRRDQFELTFFCPAKRPGARLGEKAVDRLLATMARRGIHTHLGHKLTRLDAGGVTTEGGRVEADLILYMPGMTGSAWLDATNLPRSPGGLVAADAHCRVPGFEKVYVVGDVGSFPGPAWMPKQAHMADLQAAAAAANLLAELQGQEPDQRFAVELMCIIDSLDRGTLVLRTEKRQLALPPNRLAHWAKRRFEKRYLAQYRPKA